VVNVRVDQIKVRRLPDQFLNLEHAIGKRVVAPNKPFDFDVIESFCNFVLNFASHESAERWAAERDGIVLLPAAEAFEVGLRAWSKFHTPASTEGQATA
jgi:hypothetical protein